MGIALSDRLIAGAWWLVAILVGPLAVYGFFVGGWVILAALWAWWANMDVRNPFQRQGRSRPEQVRPSSSASPPETEEFPTLPEHQSQHTTRDTDAGSEMPMREGKTDPETEPPTLPLEAPLPDASGTTGEADLNR